MRVYSSTRLGISRSSTGQLGWTFLNSCWFPPYQVIILDSAEYEIGVQLCMDLQLMPVEDRSVQWPEDKSPYHPVAKLSFPPQDTFSPQRRVYAEDVLSFDPFHCLYAHRPLGNIVRVRKLAYETSSRYRHHMNAQARR